MRQTYSNGDRARGLQALADAGGNAALAARVTGYPRTSILYWAKETGVRGTFMDKNGKTVERNGTEEDKDAAVVDWKQARSLNLAEMFDPQKVKGASLYHNTIAAGTAQDKILVLTGKPSGIFGVHMDLASFLSSAGGPAALEDGNTIEGEVVSPKGRS